MTPERPSVSVVITTLNRAGLLADCLESLRTQAYRAADEVIVVDNGSTDDTPEVVERFARTFPVALRMEREARPGKTRALLKGISCAAGEVLALTDDDVCVDGRWLATIHALFADRTLALAAGRIDPRWEQPAPRWLAMGQERYGRLASPLGLLHYGGAQPLGARTGLGGNLAIRRSVLEAVGGFALGLGRMPGTLLGGEDHELSERVVSAGYCAVYCPQLTVKHWVGVERTRLRYFLRWFFWSGVTHSLLDARRLCEKRRMLRVPGSIWKLAALAPAGAVGELVRGEITRATERLMDAAFATGYIVHRLREPRAIANEPAGGLRRTPTGSPAPAPTQTYLPFRSPADPPGTSRTDTVRN
jgi:GT2 family glycosyltransferase